MVPIAVALTFVALFCSAAQDPADLFSKAPPAVDSALRERVTRFFQANVDGRFSVAAKMVHDDSQDAFYEADKRRCKSFEIARINYEQDFTRANVLVTCETEILMAMAGRINVKMPIQSKWKVDGREWWWYVPARAESDSPFGKMKAGPEGNTSGAAVMPGPSIAELKHAVSANRDAVVFTVGKAGSEEVVFQNGLSGGVRFSALIPSSSTDLKVEFAPPALEGKGSATMTLYYTPSKSRTRRPGDTEEIMVTVEPLHNMFPIQVRFGK